MSLEDFQLLDNEPFGNSMIEVLLKFITNKEHN